jgi:hypothetical protein
MTRASPKAVRKLKQIETAAMKSSRAKVRKLAQKTSKSRRPKRTRPKTWTSDLVEAVEHLRLDFPMWDAKLGTGNTTLRLI